MSAAERSGFDLHGLHLPAGGAEALAVPKPVLGGGGQKHLAGQRHGGVQRTVAAAFDRPGQAADLLLLLLGPGVEIERQTQIEQDFCLPGPYLNTTAADFVCPAVDGDGHSNFTVMRGLYI